MKKRAYRNVIIVYCGEGDGLKALVMPLADGFQWLLWAAMTSFGKLSSGRL